MDDPSKLLAEPSMNSTATDSLTNQKLAVSLLITGHTIFILLPSLVFNIAIVLTFLLNKDLHNPLTVMYGTMLGTAIVNGITRFLTTPIYVSKMVLQCSCQAYLMEQVFSAVIYHFFYLVMLAAIATIQLAILAIHRRIAISYITVIFTVITVLLLAVPLPLFFIALTDTLGICTKVCQDGTFPTNQYGTLLAALTPIQALSLAVTVVCYVRSLNHYKTRTTVDFTISRKVASFPILMSMWMVVQALLHLVPFTLAGDQESGTNPHWSALVLNVPFFLADTTGLVLPLLLLVLSNKTRINFQLLLQKYYGRYRLFFYFAVLPVFQNVYRRYTAQVNPIRQLPQASTAVQETDTIYSQLTDC